MKNEIFGNAVKLFLRYVVVNIMCFFVAISFFVLATAVFTKTVGYEVYGTKEGTEETKMLYTHYNSDGDDLKAEQYEKDGYALRKSTIRSEMSGSQKAIFFTVAQIFCMAILIVFAYPGLWDFGAKDSNAVKFGRKAEDKWKGVRIGLIAVIPSYLVLIALCVMKAGAYPRLPVALYEFSHSAFYGFLALLIGKAITLADLPWWRLAIFFVFPLFIPVIAGIGYYLGYKDFSLREKLVYKKNRE